MLLKWWQSHITQISQNWATNKIMKVKSLRIPIMVFFFGLPMWFTGRGL
jgi:hypothetical protein